MEQAQIRRIACYGGPGQFYPVGTCDPSGTGNFEPGGSVSGTACPTPFLSFEGTADFTKTTSINRGKFTAYCGDFTLRNVIAFEFTVADYLALRAANPNPQNGDYSVTTSFVSNVGQLYWWQNPLINGTGAGNPPGVVCRFLADDPEGVTHPVVPEGLFEFDVHTFSPCGAARGWVIFKKNCMDAAVVGLPGSTVLFEMSARHC
ncbi:MAG: hypothetical protein R3E12_13735 [Candidatus Eisenbacteria bacterium]